MKHLIIIIILCTGYVSTAQKYTKIKVAFIQDLKIFGYVKYDSTDNPIDTFYQVLAKDCRYTYLTEFFYVQKDVKLGDIVALFSKALSVFQNEKSGTTYFFKGHMLSVDNLIGIKYISIHSNDSTEGGYVKLGATHIKNILSQIDKFKEWQIRAKNKQRGSD